MARHRPLNSRPHMVRPQDREDLHQLGPEAPFLVAPSLLRSVRPRNSVLVAHPRAAVDQSLSPAETPLASASSRTLAPPAQPGRPEARDCPEFPVKQERKESPELTLSTSRTRPPRAASPARLDLLEAQDPKESPEFVECVDRKETQDSQAAMAFQVPPANKAPRELPEKMESPEPLETRARTLRSPSDAKDLVDLPESLALKDPKESLDQLDLMASPALLDPLDRLDSKDHQDLTEKKDPKDQPASPERTPNTARARTASERNPAARVAQAAAVVRAVIAVLAFKHEAYSQKLA